MAYYASPKLSHQNAPFRNFNPLSMAEAERTAQSGRVALYLCNPAIAESLGESFAQKGLATTVVSHSNALLGSLQQEISLVILDPLICGVEAVPLTEALKKFKIPSLYLSNEVLPYHLAMALKQQACGYLTYQCSLQILISKITQILHGKINEYWCQEAEEMMDIINGRRKLKSHYALSQLTPRQLEVLAFLAQGKTVKEVAHVMHLSQKSVDSHKYRIMNRLQVHDRVHLARLAIREGLIEP